MRYLYETPHQIDGTEFSALFPDMAMRPLARIVKDHLSLRGLRAG